MTLRYTLTSKLSRYTLSQINIQAPYPIAAGVRSFSSTSSDSSFGVAHHSHIPDWLMDPICVAWLSFSYVLILSCLLLPIFYSAGQNRWA